MTEMRPTIGRPTATHPQAQFADSKRSLILQRLSSCWRQCGRTLKGIKMGLRWYVTEWQKGCLTGVMRDGLLEPSIAEEDSVLWHEMVRFQLAVLGVIGGEFSFLDAWDVRCSWIESNDSMLVRFRRLKIVCNGPT